MATGKETIALSVQVTTPVNNRSNNATNASNVSNNAPEAVRNEEEMSLPKRILYQFSILLNAANHILIIFLTWFIVSYGLKGSSTMYYHVIFCTVGYVLLMSEAILALANENVWSFFFNRRNKSHFHWILQVVGAAFTIAGVAIMYRVKKHHFRSVHAILGLVSVVLSCALIIFGYPVFMSFRFRKIVRPVLVKFCHNILGCICFIIGMAAMYYSYDKKWIPENDSFVSLHNKTSCLGALTIVATIIPLIGAFRRLYNLAPSVFR